MKFLLYLPIYPLLNGRNLFCRGGYVNMELNSISHIGTTMIVTNGFGSKNTVGHYNLLVVVS